MGKRHIGDALANEPRREIEVVVVQEDRGVGLAAELVDDGVCERPVHRHVPLTPRVMHPVIEVRRPRQRPEVMLEKPQRRIRDHVVEPVVDDLVVRDEVEPVGRPVARRLLDSAASSPATTRSSSVIALAIHVTSWCETRLRSAVTRPPPPRRAIRSPWAPRPNDTGPRLETTISLRRPATRLSVSPSSPTETVRRKRLRS